MVYIQDVINIIEDFAALSLQESYDNSGLIVGDRKAFLKGILITLDTTEAVVEEAVKHGCNLIVSHHPIIFSGLKNLSDDNYVQRTVVKAIQNNIAIYAAHTNIDNVIAGVNGKIADKINLINRSILKPKSGLLLKLVSFVPSIHLSHVRQALFDAGAGHIGNYDSCSYTTDGIGTFKASDASKPYVGEINKLHAEPEYRLEVILPSYLENKVLNALIASHPYEEVAYDLIPLVNSWNDVGAGIIGELKEPMESVEFMKMLKERFHLKTIRHTPIIAKEIQRVALCGGAGSGFLKDAINQKADVYLSGDFKYHEFFDADNKILIADIGHYESEQFTKNIFYELISNKLPNFAIRISEINTNPINYF